MLNALHLCYCVGGVFSLHCRVFFFFFLLIMFLFWTLMSHGSICTYVTANVIFSTFGCEIKKCSLPGLADADENCKRFVDRCMPEAFKKVSNEHEEI